MAKLQSFTMETNQKLLDVMLPLTKENGVNKNIINAESFNVDEANNSDNNCNDNGLLEEDITTGVNLQEEIQQLQNPENVIAEINE